MAREVFTVEPGRTICLDGRPIFRLAPIETPAGYAIAPAELDRAAGIVATALEEVARLGLHLDVVGVENV